MTNTTIEGSYGSFKEIVWVWRLNVIKGHIDTYDSGLIIVTDKITFMHTKRED